MSKSKAGQVIIRFWVVAFIVALFPYGLLGILANIFSFFFVLFSALLATLFFNFIQWLGHWLLFSGTKE